MKPIEEINSLIKQGRTSEAKSRLAKTQMPKAQRLSILGVIAQRDGDAQAAANSFEAALSLMPTEPTAISAYARLLIREKKRKQALELTTRGIGAYPSNPQIIEVHSAALAEMDKIPEAIDILRPLVARDEATSAQIITFASLLRSNLNPEESIEILQRHEKRLKDLPVFHKALADAYAEIDPEKASVHFDMLGSKATKSTKWNQSFTELRLGNFRKGWELYENGLSDEVGRVGRPLPYQVRGIPMITELDAIDPAKWTLFCTEQGIGDQVLFLSCMNEVLKTTKKSAFLCEQRMVPILERSFPGVKAYAYATAHNLEAQTERLNGIFPIGSLMKHLRSESEDFNRTDFPYIAPNSVFADQFRSRIRSQYAKESLVGISWTGGYWERQQKTKSVRFEALVPLIKALPNSRFIALQYGTITEEKKYAREHNLPVTFIEGVDFKKDLDKWLSLIELCDYHISVSTALVHFAAAMGKRVELLLGDRQSPFIWGLGSGQSLAYPTVRIHRRSRAESVLDFIERISGVIKT